jgi:hypothetical protein
MRLCGIRRSDGARSKNLPKPAVAVGNAPIAGASPGCLEEVYQIAYCQTRKNKFMRREGRRALWLQFVE